MKIKPYYVGRVLAADGKYYPAKVFQYDDGRMAAHYCYCGKETTSTTYEVLVVSDDSVIEVKWVKASGQKVPAYAVQGGQNILYIGRHEAKDELVVGEVNAEEGKCIVVTYMETFKFSEYEVLCAFPHASTATQ